MKHLILVDACNILHRLPAYRDRLHLGIDQLVEQLLQETRCLHDAGQWELHFIVDGSRDSIEQQFIDDLKTLSLVYAPQHATADTVIETWLMRLPSDWTVKVVSEDRSVCHSAIAHHADCLNAQQFVDFAGRSRSRTSRRLQSPPQAASEILQNRLEGLT